MNKAKQNYKSKCKKREVAFYIKDNELYERSKTINFQKFVKDCLRNKDKICTFIILERGAGSKHWEEKQKEGDKMATVIYKTVNGQKVELSAKQVKNFIMQVNGWTSEEYNKQRYIMKNKLRTYEAFTGSQQAQSPVSFMYFEAKAKQRQGANYTPSLKAQRIKSFQSLGSAKAISKAQQSQKTKAKMQKIYEATTMKQFKELIDNNPVAKKIWETVKDPVKREQALTDFVDKLKLKIKESNEVEEAQAIPFGETFGSSDEFDFDVSQYQ